MRQILQNLSTGESELVRVPAPQARRGSLLIDTTVSLISTGTERMLVDFGKANPIDKARQHPDKVRQVLDKVKTDGLVPTLEAVRSKLEQPLPLGYCNVGVVSQVGTDVEGFAVGDRVVSNGKHAEVVSVPKNLCTGIPDGVSDEEAAFTVIGAIGLQGIRLVQPTLGETIVVTGLGLIGLMTVQLLRAHGCRVLGLDFDPSKVALARQFGAEAVDLSAGQDPIAAAETLTRGRGVDGVIITASTKSNEPVHQAALMCRKRGRIVLVGVTGLELSRADFYEKELSFQVSCSYGPGRYDPIYEDQGHDYPFGFVRWTEQRNFEAVLDMMADGRLDVKPLISHRFDLAEAEKAYEVVGGSEPSLGILLNYPDGEQERKFSRTITLSTPTEASSGSKMKRTEKGNEGAVSQQAPAVSFLGSGNYATAVLIPAFRKAGARLRTVASSAGVSGTHAGRKYGFQQSTTDSDSLFADPSNDAVVITTRHDAHALQVLQALEAGKHVFVEKPLCLTLSELEQIEQAVGNSILMVGFNRRFSPLTRTIKKALDGVTGPKSFVMTVNAGAIPMDHWTQDPTIGGGRIVGEACHFIDLLRHLAGSAFTEWRRSTMASASRDTVTLQLGFADGSIGTINYFANGSKAFPKERLEVFADGRILQLDNFRALNAFGWPRVKNQRLWRQDKGQVACALAFLDAVRGAAAEPIPVQEILEVSRVSIELAQEHSGS